MPTPAQRPNTTILSGATGTGAGAWFAPLMVQVPLSFHATVQGTGAVTATILIEGSDDGVNIVNLGTITLSGTTVASDGHGSLIRWTNVRANVTAISGTGATVTVTMGS